MEESSAEDGAQADLTSSWWVKHAAFVCLLCLLFPHDHGSCVCKARRLPLFHAQPAVRPCTGLSRWTLPCTTK